MVILNITKKFLIELNGRTDLIFGYEVTNKRTGFTKIGNIFHIRDEWYEFDIKLSISIIISTMITNFNLDLIKYNKKWRSTNNDDQIIIEKVELHIYKGSKLFKSKPKQIIVFSHDLSSKELLEFYKKWHK